MTNAFLNAEHKISDVAFELNESINFISILKLFYLSGLEYKFA